MILDRWYLWTALLYGLLIPSLTACRRGDVSETRVNEKAVARSPIDDVVLNHDFGIVTPNSTSRHVFSVRNSSTKVWTLSSVSQSCSCAVARSTSEIIKPGSAESFEYFYTAASDTGNAVKSVRLQFEEPGTPRVVLRTTAKIRSHMTLAPRFVDVGPIAFAETHINLIDIDVLNYSDIPWDSIRLGKTPDWITLHSCALKVHEGEAVEPDFCRQHWRCTLAIAPNELQPGRHFEDLTLIADCGKAAAKLPLSVTVRSAVTVSPSVLMLGSVPSGSSATQRLTLRFAEPLTAATIDKLSDVVSVDEESHLRIAWKQLSDNIWSIEVGFRATGSPRLVKGQLAIKLPEYSRQVLIPYWVRITKGPESDAV